MISASFGQSRCDASLLLYGWRLLRCLHTLQGEVGGRTAFRMSSWASMSELLKWPSSCWLSLHLCPKGLIMRFGWRTLCFLSEKFRGFFFSCKSFMDCRKEKTFSFLMFLLKGIVLGQLQDSFFPFLWRWIGVEKRNKVDLIIYTKRFLEKIFTSNWRRCLRPLFPCLRKL